MRTKASDRMRHQTAAIADLLSGVAPPAPVKPKRRVRHPDPVLETCFECLEPANPCWRRLARTYCEACAPSDLKNPERARMMGDVR